MNGCVNPRLLRIQRTNTVHLTDYGLVRPTALNGLGRYRFGQAIAWTITDILSIAQRTHNAIMTQRKRLHHVNTTSATSCWRSEGVIIASRARWVNSWKQTSVKCINRASLKITLMCIPFRIHPCGQKNENCLVWKAIVQCPVTVDQVTSYHCPVVSLWAALRLNKISGSHKCS